MEDLINYIKEHKKEFAIGAGVVASLGAFGMIYKYRKGMITSTYDQEGFYLDPKFTENVLLYKEEAIKRRQIISKMGKYDLILALRKGETFDGFVTISFEVADTEFDEEDLFLDYHGLGIKDLKINDVQATTSLFDGQRITLPKKLLKIGETNVVSCSFKSKYRKNGTGFHSFIDPEDGSQYTYTQFEAFNCHRAFPCFDQPDMRAVLGVKTLSPKDWTIVSVGLETGSYFPDAEGYSKVAEDVPVELTEKYDEPYYIQTYHDSPSVTPYIYAFIAGPYDYIEQTAAIPGRTDPLLMRLYFRKSLKADAERVKEYMFEPTVQGIHWYSEFFGYDYPYQKYDQIFAPEFKFGAMENLGTVTFTERLLFRGKEISEKDWTTLINVVLHELCHHWFGNLVTMKWWNDLWCNESFATYVSYLCMYSVEALYKKCPNLWVSVNSYKNWGYAEDDLATGHPICKQAPHTDSADDMINGITYGKGCSFLKQLFHLIGYEAFSMATKIYFDKYQWKNTELNDFLGCLDEAYEKCPKKTENIVVSEWAKTFLNTRGANTFEGVLKADQLVVTQEVSQYSDGLRTQKVDVTLFDEKFDQTIESFMTSEEEKETVVKLAPGKHKYYILNHGDHAYGKIIIDEATSEFLSKNLSSVKESLTRAIVWKGIQGMVKVCKIKSTKYFEFVQNNLPSEDQTALFETVVQTAGMLIGAYIPDQMFEETCSTMFKFFYELLIKEKREKVVPTLANALFNFLHTVEDTETAMGWIEAENVTDKSGNKIEGAVLSKNNKFSIVQSAYAKESIELKVKEELLEKVLGDDKSDIANNLRLTCKTLLPDAKSKEEAWAEISDHSNTLSSYERNAMMGGFFNRESAEILKPYYDQYVKKVEESATCGNKEFMVAFIRGSCPGFNITDEFIESLKKVVAQFSDDVQHDSFCRSVNQVIESLEINKKIKDFASA